MKTAYLLLGIALCLVVACSRDEEISPGAGPHADEAIHAGDPIDATAQRRENESRLSHFADQVRSAHQQAEQIANEKTNPQGVSQRQEAASRLRDVLLTPSLANTPDVLAVKQDLAARASQLYLEAGHFNEASIVVDEGLSLSRDPSVLRAQLLITLADIKDAQGDHTRARAALVEALQVNQDLLSQELSAP